MRILVMSLRRLYRAGMVTDKRLEEMAAAGTITKEEKDYIQEEERR